MTFSLKYFLLFIVMFVTEVSIATFLSGGFIRHTLGDFIVVILLYCFLMSFIKLGTIRAVIISVIFTYTIEFLQLIKILKLVYLDHNKYANLVLGSTFSIVDLMAYTLGGICIIVLELSLSRYRID